jgi:hypothetical protein
MVFAVSTCNEAVSLVVSRTSVELLLIAIFFVSALADLVRADRFVVGTFAVVDTFDAIVFDSLVKFAEKMDLLLTGKSSVSETKADTLAARTDVLLARSLVVLTGTFDMLLSILLSMDGAFQRVLVGILISSDVLASLSETKRLVLLVELEEFLILKDSLCSLMLGMGASALLMAELICLLFSLFSDGCRREIFIFFFPCFALLDGDLALFICGDFVLSGALEVLQVGLLARVFGIRKCWACVSVCLESGKLS